jgi:hypothetical protein
MSLLVPGFVRCQELIQGAANALELHFGHRIDRFGCRQQCVAGCPKGAQQRIANQMA